MMNYILLLERHNKVKFLMKRNNIRLGENQNKSLAKDELFDNECTCGLKINNLYRMGAHDQHSY